MGAQTFSTLAVGSDPQVAFRQAHAEAVHEYGHGGYTGTLAEKQDFVVLRRAPLALAAAERWAAQALDQEAHPAYRHVSDKWGPAGALPVLRHPSATRQWELTLNTEQRGHLDLDRLVQGRVALAPGEQLTAVTILDDRLERRPTVRTTPGRATTRYLIVRRDSFRPAPGSVPQGYPSMAAARQACRELLQAPRAAWSGSELRDYEVVGVVRREDDQPLLTASEQQHRRQVQLQLTAAQVPDGTLPDAWLFFGWASC